MTGKGKYTSSLALMWQQRCFKKHVTHCWKANQSLPHSYLQPVHLLYCLSYLRHNTHFCKTSKKRTRSVINLTLPKRLPSINTSSYRQNHGKPLFLACAAFIPAPRARSILPSSQTALRVVPIQSRVNQGQVQTQQQANTAGTEHHFKGKALIFAPLKKLPM